MFIIGFVGRCYSLLFLAFGEGFESCCDKGGFVFWC